MFILFFFNLLISIQTLDADKTETISYETDTVFTHCLSVDMGNCQICETQYFLFTLPQDNDESGLQAGTRLCVACPFKNLNDENNSNNLYCGDCIDNSQTWDNSRLCTYDYMTKTSEDNSVYHKIARDDSELFYVIQSGQEGFTTTICDGCANFCSSKSSTCFPVSSQYQYDLNNLYITCATGFAYSDAITGCDSCPDNCYSCIINVVREIDDESDEITSTSEKTCMVCNEGFSLLQLRDQVDKASTTSLCIGCLDGCDICYFGLDEINLNSEPWDEYNNDESLLYTKYVKDEEQFYTKLFSLFSIAQRCITCTSSGTNQYVPSLDRQSCVRCGTNCRKCEYVSYTLNDYASRTSTRIIETTSSDYDAYILRCRECVDISQTISATGTQCIDCTTENCRLCAKVGDSSLGSDDSFTTMALDFTPLDKEEFSKEQCLLCEDENTLMDDYTCGDLPDDNHSLTGCLSYLYVTTNSYSCTNCEVGYSLSQNSNGIWTCTLNCYEMLQDYMCQTCVNNDGTYRCLICLDGFYVNMLSGKCEQCSANGYCKYCYTYSLQTISYPNYYLYEYDNDATVYGPYCSTCTDGGENQADIGPSLNEDLRYCEKGGTYCTKYYAQGEKGYCDQCVDDSGSTDVVLRSSSDDDTSCLVCPQYTLGCRIRTTSEIAYGNNFFNPDDADYDTYSYLAFICLSDSYELNTELGRCVQNTTNTNGESRMAQNIQHIYIAADCDSVASDVNLIWKINAQYSDVTSTNATLILENKIDAAKKIAYYQSLNKNTFTKVVLHLVFSYKSESENNKCLFQKNTYFTSNFRKNVFSINELELDITVDQLPAGEFLNWYIQDTIYFQYFTTVSIKGIKLMPAKDYDLNPDKIITYEKPYGFKFIDNDGLIFILDTVQIFNQYAYEYYNGTSYTTPQSDQSLIRKKYRPFFTTLLNAYDIQLTNVLFQSQSYLLGDDISFQAKPFELTYDSDIYISYFNIKLTDVTFCDVSVESQAIFELQDLDLQTANEWNSKIYLQNVKFIDAYFVNEGCFIGTDVLKTSMGMIIADQLFINRAIYNNSRGIIDVTTMQRVSVSHFTLTNSQVNYTSLFYITTLDLSHVYVYNTTFSYFGKLIATQFQLYTIRPKDTIYSGLKLTLTDLEFDSIICLYPSCIMLISTIKNDYEIPVNISMSDIVVKNINTTGFNETILEAATSAAMYVEKCYTLEITNFQSIENADITIFYTDQVQETYVMNLQCYQNKGISIRNNYCMFFNNFYRKIQMSEITLQYLNGIDNSFVGISSWSNLIYNTSSSIFKESIVISNLLVDSCSITTTVLAVYSSALLIDSSQEQNVTLSNLQFVDNRHYTASYIKGTLRASNPTLLINSVVGTLSLSDSIWKNNSVTGFGAVSYLSCGTQTVDNITMYNSNFDPISLIDGNPFSIDLNEISEGGHLYIGGYNLTLINSLFTNSSAKVGGAIYIKTYKDGLGYFNNTKVYYSYTPMNGEVVSSGGCVYLDATGSNLNFTMNNMDFKECIARAYGGGIYVVSSDLEQYFTLSNTLMQNCYSLSGSALKISFNQRTTQTQKSTLTSLSVSGNYTDANNFFSNLTNFTLIEEFLYIKRLAAIEQDNGQLEIQNAYCEGLFYEGFLSVVNPNYIKFNTLEIQHSIITYRPVVEVIEPLVNSISIDTVQFRNISSFNISVTCTDDELTNIQNALCKILQARIDFPEYVINPAMMFVDQITKNTPILLKNIFVSKVYCTECYGGLVQVMRVSNSELRALVQLVSCRCSNSQTSYYGCYMISSSQYPSILTTEDSQIGVTYVTALNLSNILAQTGLSSRRRRLLESSTSTFEPSDFDYTVTDPTYLAHVEVDSLNIQEISAIHGGGISFYGLTVNVTTAYCTQSIVTGQGGCIYYEAPTKNGKIVYQRLNIAQSVFFRNNASIGGAIRVKESGINDWTQTQNTLLQNYASLFGNDIAGYPTHMGVLVSGTLQSQSYLDSNTGWLHYPLVIKSGQSMSKFEEQTVVVVYLDDDDNIMKYQFNAQANMTSNISDTIQGESLRIFNLDSQGFTYSNLEILFDPYQNITLDITLNSSLVNIPRYYDKYPYQLMGFDVGYTLQARVRSVECEPGEAYNTGDGSCTPCPEKQYVLAYKGICKQIDESSMNYTILDKISVKFGYWRPNHLNDLAEQCKNKQVNCKGGYDVGDDLCYEGLIGALCEECDIHGTYWGKQYSNSAKYECGTCQDKTRNIIMIVFLSIFTLYSTISSAKANQERMENTVLYGIFANLGWASSQKASGNVAVLMKIFNNHTQILSILSGFQISIPTGAVDSVNTISMPAKTTGNSLDCFLANDTWGIDLIYFRLIWSLIMQGIYLVAMIVIMGIGVAFGKITFKVQYIQTIMIFMFVYLQPNYVMEFMTLISPRLISGINYIMANVSYKYDTFKHDQWMTAFGIPGLLLWIFILPVTFWYIVHQGAQRLKLDSFFFCQSWGFFYHEYRRERYYWEFLKIFYRSGISVLICYFQEEITVQGILSFFVVYAYYGLASHFNPYNSRVLNDLDQLSTVVLSLSLIIGVFLYRTIVIDFYGLTYAGYVVIAALNLVFLLLFFYNLFKGKLQEFAPMLDDIREKINEKFPHLKNNPRLRPYLVNQTKLNAKARHLWVQLSKTVHQGIDFWRQDKSRPLQFFKYIEMPPQDHNLAINKIHLEYSDSQYDLLNKNGNGSILHSQEQMPNEEKENYQYQ